MATETIDSGGGGDWTTWQAWEDNLPATLLEAEVGQGINEEIVSSSNILTIAGHTTTATFTITVTARAGDSFIDNANIETNALQYNASNGCALQVTGAYNSNAGIIIDDTNVFITRLQVQATHNGGGVTITTAGATGLGPTIDQCISDHRADSGFAPFGSGTLVKNSLLIQSKNNSLRVVHGFNTGSWINCTLVSKNVGNDPNDAFEVNYGTTTVTNCAIFGCDTTDIGNSTFNYTTCFVDTSNTPSGCTQATGTDQFVALQSDWRLKLGADCIDAGTTDATNGTPSINGVARSAGNYDVGCWEFFVAAGGMAWPSRVKQMSHLLNR